VLVLAAGVAAAVALTQSGGSKSVQTRQIDGQDLGSVVNQLDSLIDDNVR
jgi:hypothetical protein